MAKALIVVGALLCAGLPAAFGLMGNTSFTQDQPVRVPGLASETGGHPEEDHGGDDRRYRHGCHDPDHTGRDD